MFHDQIRSAIRDATIECLLSIATGDPEMAVSISTHLADATNRDSCDVIDTTSNYALFMVIHAVAETVLALFLIINNAAVVQTGRKYNAVVQMYLTSARDDIEEALSSITPSSAPAIRSDGRAGSELRASIEAIRGFIVKIIAEIPEGALFFPNRGNTSEPQTT